MRIPLLRSAFAALLAAATVPLAAQDTITDAVFLETLQHTVPAALNGNVLDTLHPSVLACTKLLPSQYASQDHWCYSVEGVRHFRNLDTLGLRYCAVSELRDLPNTLRYLNVDYQEGLFSRIDRWPDSLRYVSIRHDWYWNGPNFLFDTVPPFPTHLEYLDLYGMASVDSLPTLPASLRHLDVTRCDLSELPALPNGLEYLNVNHLVVLPALTDLPSSLLFLDIGSSPMLDTLGALPEGLQELHALYASGLTELPALPPAL
ncbi:MAG TPA: hypothetical protein VHL57_12985, partial [Flavobacteriales bacterium]|nr:hypothetical protein [Flavobacteriales bacterium]